MRSLFLSSLLVFAAAATLGCQKPKQAAPAPSRAEPIPSFTPPSGPPLPPSSPPVAVHGAVPGEVLEKIDTAGYSYLRLRTGSGELWAAVPQTDAKVGSKVTVLQQMAADHFVSDSLHRTFDHVIFGTLQGAPGLAAPGETATGEAPANPSMGGGEQFKGPVKTEKATGPNAKTVSELFATRASVKDQPVAVRGTVVKFLPNIMGKNFLHLRDGSGSDAAQDNDLTVTTLDTAAVGDVVTAQGTARVDTDLGAGYRYPVMLGDAKLTK